jgi:hypothetical protein
LHRFGIARAVSAGQSAKASQPIDFSVKGKVIEASAKQRSNADGLIVLHPVPTVTFVMDRHDRNAPSPISQSSGIATCLRPLLQKAKSPIRAQPCGIFTLVREMHQPKLSLLIACIRWG